MRDRRLMNESEETARQHLVLLAKAMLDGDLSFFEGAPQILALKGHIDGVADRDPDFDAFVAIASETDHLPLKRQRTLWSAEALKRLEPEYAHTEQWASSFAPPACKSLISRFQPD